MTFLLSPANRSRFILGRMMCTNDSDTFSEKTAFGMKLVSLVLIAGFSLRLAAAPIPIPYDLFPYQEYRLAFVTTDTTTAQSDNIADYNAFVTALALAQPELAVLNTAWWAIASTPTIDARTNTSTNPMLDTGVPIYQMDGVSRVANDNFDLWDGTIGDFPTHPTGLIVDETGSEKKFWSVHTGTRFDGQAAPFANTLGNGSGGHAVGKNNNFLGPDEWIHCCTDPDAAARLLPMYGMSGVLTVPRSTVPAGPHGTLETIAFHNDPAPDGIGRMNGLTGTPVLNDAGAVLFTARYDGANALILDDGIAQYQLLREPEPAPDGNGVLASLTQPGLSNDGSAFAYAAFAGSSGGFADDKAIYDVDGGTGLVIRETYPADGNGSYVTFNRELIEPLPVNDLGQIALLGRIGGAVPFSSQNVVRGDGGGLVELVRAGEVALTGFGNYSNFGPPDLNDVGEVAFLATFPNLVAGEAKSAILRHDGAGATLIMGDNADAPDFNGTIDHFDDRLALNDVGEVAFAASFDDTNGGFLADDFGMLRGDGATTVVIARAGDAAPEGNGTFSPSFTAFTRPVINTFGEVAFRTTFAGTTAGGIDNDGIVKGNVKPGGSSLVEIVREGWALPGGGDTFDNPRDPTDVNDAGVVAFMSGRRSGAGGVFADHGIYLGDGIDVVEIAAVGSALSGGTIFELTLGGFGITRGSLNRHGQVAFSARISTPGTSLRQGVYLFTPDLYWRGGTAGDWDEAFTTLGDVNPNARRHWTLSLVPDAPHHVILDRSRGAASGFAVPSIAVTGPQGDLTIDRLTLREETALELTGAQFTASDGISIEGGRLHGAGTVSGAIHIAAGSLEADGMTVHGGIVNDDLLAVTRGAHDFAIFNAAITNNGMTVIDNPGQLAASATFNGEFLNQGSLTVGLNQLAEFVGDYRGTGAIANDGTIIFHGLGPGASPAHVEVAGTGTIELAAGGTTTMELGGSVRGAFHGDPTAEYDSLTFIDGGILALGGALEVVAISPDGLAPEYVPALGDVFTLFLAGQILGGFDDALVLPALAEDLRWLIRRDGTSYALEVAAVPLPASAWFMLMVLALLPLARRGRTQHHAAC